jgi:hypothetical protein
MKNSSYFKLVKLTVILALTFSIMSCKPTAVKPDGSISMEEAVKKEADYLNHIYGKELDYKDNREFYFTMEELEKMINYSSHVGDSLELYASGLRAYLGAEMDKNGQWKTELFFVPTTSSENNPSSTDPNIIDTGAYNKSQSGMPPIPFINP